MNNYKIRLNFSIIILGAIWSNMAWGQKVILSTPTHYAKWPLDNYYRFIAKNIPCSRIVFKSDNGKFSQAGCKLFYYPDTAGNTTFKVYQKYTNRLRLVDSIHILIDYEEPTVTLGTKTGGIISKTEVLAIGGLIVRKYITEDHTEPITLIGYTMITLHNDTTRSVHNTGNKYSDEAKSLLANLQPNDRLIFANIAATDRSKRTLLAKPIEFKIE
jgi:hypothetical protein